MPDKTKIVRDESGHATFSNLENAVNAAADVAHLLTAAPGYPRGNERDEALASAAYRLDERVGEASRALATVVGPGQACRRANPSSRSNETLRPVSFVSFQWGSLRLPAGVRRPGAIRTAPDAVLPTSQWGALNG
jgi:hypothetical protein